MQIIPVDLENNKNGNMAMYSFLQPISHIHPSFTTRCERGLHVNFPIDSGGNILARLAIFYIAHRAFIEERHSSSESDTIFDMTQTKTYQCRRQASLCKNAQLQAKLPASLASTVPLLLFSVPRFFMRLRA